MAKGAKTDSAKKKCTTRRENSNSSKLSWKSRKNPPKVHNKNIPFVLCTISNDRIYHILSSRVESSEKFGFESDGSSVIVDNYANAHIYSEEYMFTKNIEIIISNGVENIGGKYLITKGIVTVIWYYTNYEGQLHTKKWNNVLYFTDSPVNIIS